MSNVQISLTWLVTTTDRRNVTNILYSWDSLTIRTRVYKRKTQSYMRSLLKVKQEFSEKKDNRPNKNVDFSS
jgi:hypothetical protein